MKVKSQGDVECSMKHGSIPKEHNSLKVRNNFNLFKLNKVPQRSLGNLIKKAKLVDVKKLLLKAGITGDHPSLSFYRELDQSQQSERSGSVTDESDTTDGD